jgi:FAD/FMN-containing dehydrogenase
MDHQQKLDKVVNRVKALSLDNEKAYVFHGSTNTTRALNFKKSNIVDLSDFGEILEIDEQNQTITAEPNVPMDRLVDATLKHNLIPPVVMEWVAVLMKLMVAACGPPKHHNGWRMWG